MKKLYALLSLFCLIISLSLSAQTLQQNLWVTNGTVSTIVTSGTTVYIGGDFTVVGPNAPYGASLSTSTGSPDLAFAKPNGIVRAVVPDGSGGWYIGGSFTMVGTVLRNHIARINADGTVHSWDPNAGSTVTSIAVSGSTVYAGGLFTTIGGQTRNYIAALDAGTGLASSWNPNAGNTVNSIAVSGSTVYVGGSFTTIGGQGRNSMAALDATTGAASSWNPNASGPVLSIAVSGSTVYAGGDFTTIGGQGRNYIAALDATTGLAGSWDPNANSAVYSLAVSGSTVYAGGSFTTIGGELRASFAGFSITTLLPVRLLSFSATSKNTNSNETVLNWATASEENSSRFIVERSARGGGFTPMTELAAKGASTVVHTYTWIDREATQPVSFYRLKMVDIDGRFSYSRIVSVNKQVQLRLSLYPNPVQNEASLNIPSQGKDVLLLTITDQSGRTTERRLVQITEGNNAVSINTAGMPSGIYIISINGSNRNEQVQMLKQ